MIEYDLVQYLNSDAILDALLGAVALNGKIYPNQAPQNTAMPYIVYNISNEGTLEENLREITFRFDIVDDNYIPVKLIRDRLSILLDRQDKIRDYLTSDSYYLYWAKHISGSDYKEADRDLFHKEVIVQFKYAQK
jgi:hypothetical protein